MKTKTEIRGCMRNQGMPEGASKTPTAGEKAWNRFSLRALRRHQSFQHLDLGRLTSRPVRHSVSVVRTTHFVVFRCSGSPSKLIH